MKKFLSLLLTLTMVLSLAVVPARAGNGDGEDTGSGSGSEPATPVAVLTLTPRSASAKEGQPVIFDVVATLDGVAATISNATWVPSGGTYDAEAMTYTVTAGSQSFIAACSGATLTTGADDTLKTVANVNSPVSPEVAVTSKADEANAKFRTDLLAAITVKYNNRPYSGVDGTFTAYKYAGESDSWAITVSESFQSAYDVTIPDALTTGELTISGKTKPAEGEGVDVSTKITLATQTSSFTATAAPTTVTAGGVVVLGIQSGATLPSSGLSYKWEYAKAADAPTFSPIGNGASFNWAVKGSDGKDLAEGAYVVKCTVTDGQATVATDTVDVTVQKDIWALYPTTLNTINLAVGQSATLPVVGLYTKNAGGSQDTKVTGLTYTWTSNSARISVDTGKVTALSGASGNYKLTVSTTYQGKTYSKEVTVRVSSLSYELDAVANGSYRSYSISTLKSAASSVIRDRVGHAVTVDNLTLKTTSGSASLLYGTLKPSSNSYIYTAPSATLGKATFVMTVTTRNDGSFDVTYTIPVIPNSRAFEAQYPQVSTSGSNYIYTVSAPSGFDRIYVINKTGATPTTSQLTTMPSGAASVSLSASDFNSATGKCTLYIMAWNSNYSSSSSSYGKYYYGTLEVYLQSNDIEYTGVAGSTVNFQHSSFTAFLNAMNVSTSTDYYEFQDVTFTYFNSTTQGTLYYGSTAMTSGTYNSSSYFNSATKITNLDNVSFAIKSTIPSTIKTISVPFQLHAKQYRSGTYSSTFVRDVTFSGRVVISVAREDVVINVAAGDAVKLDATAFLTYLRNSSTSYRNANIDYVTFSQNLSVSSSSSAYVNGALYTYYTNSYSFGNPVTSTDRFYYNPTTYNVNRLSDVAFRANAYASAGTTVYIPFTIKLLNSNATVTGTLAAKIANAVNFYDVAPGAYYYDAVKWAVGAGVTKGTGNNMFSPAKSCTRAEIVTFLWRAAKSPAPKSYSNPFTDVYSGMGSDFYNAILWAVGEGITTGTTTSKFSPNDTCTRGQIVTFLHRYLKTPSGYYSNPFKDVKSGYYCYNAVIWAYGSGVAKGSSATTFSPDATCTRGDAVTFLYRALVK